jgi:hypothetical protein
MREYSNRQWLNPEGHPSTGSIVAYHGKAPWKNNKKQTKMTILEISDCHEKVRLHRGDTDSMEEFIWKMKKLRDVVDEFIDHLSHKKETKLLRKRISK